jgi:hypothetical protein
MSNLRYLLFIILVGLCKSSPKHDQSAKNFIIDNVTLNDAKGINITNNSLNRSITSEQLVDFNLTSTSIYILNTNISSNNIILANNNLLTNIISNNTHINTFNLAKNFSQIYLSNLTIYSNGDLIVSDNSISIYLNDKAILNHDSLFLISIFISNVYLVNGNVKINSNKVGHNILIEKLTIQNGDLIIQEDFLFTGTIIIREANIVNGKIIIENVSVAKKILIEKETVFAKNGINVCQRPYSPDLKSYKLNGCYIYYGVSNRFQDAMRICNNMGGQILKAYNREILADFPKFPNILKPTFYWVRCIYL